MHAVKIIAIVLGALIALGAICVGMFIRQISKNGWNQ